MKRYVVLWLLSLVLVATASAWIAAQITQAPQHVISGSDVGVQVDSTDGKFAYGRIVVRIDGRWLELGPSARAYRLQGQ